MVAFELEILKTIQNTVGCGFMDSLMTAFSFIGNWGLLWIVVAVLMLISKKYRKTGIMLAVGLVLGLIFGNLILKNLVARPRPCWIVEDIEMLIDVPKDFSFPSGHTLSSFVAAFILLDRDKRFGIPAICIAAMIAFSRMYLFVHFPTDILGGIALAGLIFAGLKSSFFKEILKQVR